jgi:hypothetical protein
VSAEGDLIAYVTVELESHLEDGRARCWLSDRLRWEMVDQASSDPDYADEMLVAATSAALTLLVLAAEGTDCDPRDVLQRVALAAAREDVEAS